MNAPLTDWDAPEYNEAAIGGGPKTIDVDAPEEGEATDQVINKTRFVRALLALPRDPEGFS